MLKYKKMKSLKDKKKIVIMSKINNKKLNKQKNSRF